MGFALVFYWAFQARLARDWLFPEADPVDG